MTACIHRAFDPLDTEEPYTEADRDKPKTFWNTRLEITPCCNVSLKEAEITLWFRTDGNFSGSDALFFELPRKWILVLS